MGTSMSSNSGALAAGIEARFSLKRRGRTPRCQSFGHKKNIVNGIADTGNGRSSGTSSWTTEMESASSARDSLSKKRMNTIKPCAAPASSGIAATDVMERKNLAVCPAVHKRVKIAAITEGRDMQGFTEELLSFALRSRKQPRKSAPQIVSK